MVFYRAAAPTCWTCLHPIGCADPRNAGTQLASKSPTSPAKEERMPMLLLPTEFRHANSRAHRVMPRTVQETMATTAVLCAMLLCGGCHHPRATIPAHGGLLKLRGGQDSSAADAGDVVCVLCVVCFERATIEQVWVSRADRPDMGIEEKGKDVED